MIMKQGKNRLLAGRITKDVEVKTVETKKGSRFVAKFGVGVAEGEFANITAWGDMATYAGTFLKGDFVLVAGVEGEPREFNGKTYVDISPDYIALQPTAQPRHEMPSRSATPYAAPPPEMQEIDSDLPF